ncbi:MAG: DinB family protein [Endozoicomonas sp.]
MTFSHACQFNDEALAELEYLVRTISEPHYQASLSSRSSSIGTHVRHIIEFYQCLLQGLSIGMVDYDKRDREQNLESSPIEALKQLEIIRAKLTTIERNTDIVLTVCTGTDGKEISTSSNVLRELLFLQSHTTHHLAVIALLLERTGADIPGNLGIATSTRVYRQNLATASETVQN